MPGYQDRENAAAKLASEVPVGESSGDDDEDNNGEPPLLDVATGAKTKTSSRSSAGIRRFFPTGQGSIKFCLSLTH